MLKSRRASTVTYGPICFRVGRSLWGMYVFKEWDYNGVVHLHTNLFGMSHTPSCDVWARTLVPQQYLQHQEPQRKVFPAHTSGQASQR